MRILAKKHPSATVQVTEQVRQGYNIDQLDDVRIIRDRQTSTSYRAPSASKPSTDTLAEVSRGFGFLRFPSVEASKSFLEHNYPSIYLYGKESADSDNQAAKVRVAFSRERVDIPRGDKEGEWACKIVCDPLAMTKLLSALLITPSALSSTFPQEADASSANHHKSVHDLHHFRFSPSLTISRHVNFGGRSYCKTTTRDE